MLTRVFSADDWKTFADCRSDHERVSRAKSILVGLSQLEVLKVESELTHIRSLLDGHLTGVSSVVASWKSRIHESRLVLVCFAAASEL